MKDTIKLILFLMYSILVFFIKEYILLGMVLVVNLFFMYQYKVPIKKAFYHLRSFMFFILFAMLINMIFSGIESGILIGMRLILVCNMAYLFSYILSPIQLVHSLENLLYPMKLFGIQPQDIGLMINIALTFIPILLKEFSVIKYALKAKGISFHGIYGIKNFNYIVKPFLYSIIQRITQLEYSIKIKGYIEN